MFDTTMATNIAALIKNRNVPLSDGIYPERTDEIESAFEERLRKLVSRLPHLKSKIKSLKSFIETVDMLDADHSELNDKKLANAFEDVCSEIRRSGFTDDLMAKSFSIVREATARTLGMRHHHVQLMGGWGLLKGMITEMGTGEGKTLVATLAACSAAATGAAVHVITTNDYLAERDAEINLPLYRFFDLSIGIVKQGMPPHERQIQYAKDIVYVSNKEIVFDYLKDRIATKGARLCQHLLRGLYKSNNAQVLLRGLHFAIVDEADSVLIDEARTPLIISETLPDEIGNEVYQTAIERASRLVSGEHFFIDSHREVIFTPHGENFIDELCDSDNGLWSSAIWRRDLIENAVKALHIFQRDEHYIISENKIQIVDEFSGRVMPDRSWERGLHQMIEAKEGCEISGLRRTLSRITYQRFFRKYILLSGMTGTATEISSELKSVYDLRVLKIPPHKPSRRQRLPNQCWLTSNERWMAVTQRSIELSRKGRAILIGTRSVEGSEHLAKLFIEKGIAHKVLNARQDREEADIVARAGESGRITIATNMAGRGTDIKLDDAVKENGGLHVILTEIHESARIDRQLFGRSARQGETGTTEAFISLEDEIFSRFSPTLLKLITRITKRSGQVPPRLLNLLIRYTQAVAEIQNARVRATTIKEDNKFQRLLSFSDNI